MKKTKIAALLLSAALSVSAFSVPALAADTTTAITAEATNTWNGKTALEAGKTYTVEKNIIISKKITIPSKTTVIIKDGCTATIKSTGKLYVKGTLKVEKGATVKVSGILYLYKSKNIKNYGTINFGTKANATINGKLYNYSTGVIKGEPASLKIGTKSKITNKGKITVAAFAGDTPVAALPDEATLVNIVKTAVDGLIFDADLTPIFKAALPDELIQIMTAQMAELGMTMDDLVALMASSLGSMDTINVKDADGIEKQIKIIDIAGTQMTAANIAAIPEADVKTYQASLDETYAAYGVTLKVESGVRADLTLTITTIDGVSYSSSEAIVFMNIGGKYYISATEGFLQ